MNAQAVLSLPWAHSFCWFCHVAAHIKTGIFIILPGIFMVQDGVRVGSGGGMPQQFICLLYKTKNGRFNLLLHIFWMKAEFSLGFWKYESNSLPPEEGARWLSGRVSDSETYRRRVVSLSKTLYSPKVLVNYPGSDGSVPIWLKNCWLGR